MINVQDLIHMKMEQNTFRLVFLYGMIIEIMKRPDYPFTVVYSPAEFCIFYILYHESYSKIICWHKKIK